MTNGTNFSDQKMDSIREQGSITQDARYLQMVDALAEVMQQTPETVSLDALCAELVKTFNIAEASASATVKQVMTDLYQAVEVKEAEFGWLTNLLDGSNVRHPLTSDEAQSGFLLLDELEHAVFFPEFFQTHQPDERVLHIQLFGGPRIPAEAYIESKTWALRLGDQFVEWVDQQGGQGRDDIIIMVDNASAGDYTIRLQPREFRDDNLIQSRNVQLSLLAESIVRRSCLPNVAMHTWDIAAVLMSNNLFDEMVPPDDMHCVLHQYSMLRFNGKVGYLFNPDDEKNAGEELGERSFPPFGFSESSEPGDKENRNDNDGESRTIVDVEMTIDMSSDSEHLDTHNDSDYDYYVERLYQIGLADAPLSQNDFLLLKAELKALMSIERECGRLLDEQRHRRHELISFLLIRQESLSDDSDIPDQQDYDDPACWDN